MRIAVDAMGGDFAPREVVRGAIQAASELDGIRRILLVGDEAGIKAEIDAVGGSTSKLSIVHASETIDMDEAPAQAVRRKKDSSISRAVDLVKDGEADAVLSAGNTGAVMVASTLKLRKLDGVERPAIATVMPTRERPFVLLDAGANTDCTPEFLLEFAIMGAVYSRVVLGCESPVVGLLSIGGEELKGNDTTREAFKLLSEAGLNFKGNVEGHDLFEGRTDVVVCDGFVGNVVLKTAESASMAIAHWMKEEFKRNPLRILGAVCLSGALRTMKRKLDPAMYGGAPLLGVNGVVIITHGASRAKAIFHSIRVAKESVIGHMNELISSEIRKVKPVS